MAVDATSSLNSFPKKMKEIKRSLIEDFKRVQRDLKNSWINSPRMIANLLNGLLKIMNSNLLLTRRNTQDSSRVLLKTYLTAIKNVLKNALTENGYNSLNHQDAYHNADANLILLESKMETSTTQL
jgi:hypothetical protein